MRRPPKCELGGRFCFYIDVMRNVVQWTCFDCPALKKVLSVCCGGHAVMLLEYPYEVGNILKAAVVCDVLNTFAVIFQHCGGLLYAAEVDVFRKSAAAFLVKKLGEIAAVYVKLSGY